MGLVSELATGKYDEICPECSPGYFFQALECNNMPKMPGIGPKLIPFFILMSCLSFSLFCCPLILGGHDSCLLPQFVSLHSLRFCWPRICYPVTTPQVSATGSPDRNADAKGLAFSSSSSQVQRKILDLNGSNSI